MFQQKAHAISSSKSLADLSVPELCSRMEELCLQSFVGGFRTKNITGRLLSKMDASTCGTLTAELSRQWKISAKTAEFKVLHDWVRDNTSHAAGKVAPFLLISFDSVVLRCYLIMRCSWGGNITR